ncbi:MAG: glycosyltransferase family 39 protein [Williamsia sp.]|nr:glycosyltransferase family 39 protein [Williamsia sp.]
MRLSSTRLLYLLIIFAALLNASGLFLTILGPDGSLYASIAKNMVLRSDYIQLFGEGREWLDKPHFPFWVTAFFFRCFGFSTWAYKLPALLFLYAAAVYTYLFARRLYNRETALWSVLILLSAEHIVVSSNDVRAEPYLTALIVGSVYHFYRSMTEKKFLQLVLASLLAACAVMTKGMMALVPIGGAVAGELLIKKRWKEIFHLRWLIAGLLVFLFIIPELASLYYQFDAHPEKIVFGRTGVSGIRFFFWDSQFGRFFNTGPIKGKGDPFFFLHTLLWAFLPWSVLLYVALGQFIRRGWREPQRVEWYCITGSMLLFLLFSASRFQLPHYLNIVFPFFAILTAQYLLGLKSRRAERRTSAVQSALAVLLSVGAVALFVFYQPPDTFIVIVTLIAGLLTGIMLISNVTKDLPLQRALFQSAWVSVVVNLFLNIAFYPPLLTYQSGSEAAFWINKNNPQKLPVAQLVHQQYAFALDFYLDQPLYTLDTVHKKYPPTPYLLYIHPSAREVLLQKGWQLQPMKSFAYFSVTKLKGSFINNRTRSEVVSAYELVLVQKD